MTQQQFSPAVALLLMTLGAVGMTANAQSRAPRPAPNFPSLESYYPVEAKRAGQEGATIMHFCVDTNGKLTSPPTVALSSGNDAIDSGAVKLANAGIYLPGSLDGVAREACAEFKIKFELRDNPLLRMANFRIPAISTRVEALSTEYAHRLLEVEKKVEKPQPIALSAATPEAAKNLRRYARALDAALDESVALVADMMDDMDYLGQSPDIPENERTVFTSVWPNERAAFAHKFRQLLEDSRNVVRSLDERADYISFSTLKPPQGTSEVLPQTASQDDRLDEVRDRALGAIRKVEGSLEALSSKGPPN